MNILQQKSRAGGLGLVLSVFALLLFLPRSTSAAEYELIQYNQPAEGTLGKLESVGDLTGNARENLVGVRAPDGFNSELVFLEIGEDGRVEILWVYPLPKNYLGEWVDFTISDLDQNGNPEIVAISNIVSSSGRRNNPVDWLFVFEWNGMNFPDQPTASWGYQDTEGIFPRPNQIIPGDPDGDGLTEFIISFTSPVPRIMILEFSGDYSTPGWNIEYYSLPEILASGLKPFALGVADITGDQQDDVVIFQRRDTDLLVIRISASTADQYETGNITTIPLDFSREIIQSRALAFADLTGNNRDEALLGTNSGKTYLLRFADLTEKNLPHPRLAIWHQFDSAVNAIHILDYNGDQRHEIVTHTKTSLYLLEQIRSGDEHFANFVSLLSEPVGQVTSALPFLGGVLYTNDEEGVRIVTQFIPKDFQKPGFSMVEQEGESESAETVLPEVIQPKPITRDSLSAEVPVQPGKLPPVKPPRIVPLVPDLVVTAGEQLEYLIPMGEDIDPANLQLRFVEYPQGMKVGRDFTLHWNTSMETLGFHKIQYVFTDKIDTTLWVYVNAPPVITSLAPEYVEVGHQFLYRVGTEDKNSDAVLKYSLDLAPGGMTIDSTGLIQWQPTIAQLDTQWIDVKVSDGYAVSHQRFPVYVNSPPVILKEPHPIAYQNEPYKSRIVFRDDNQPNNARVTVLNQPDSLVITPQGDLSWTPGKRDYGIYEIIYQVTDDYVSLTDSFAIFVNAPPRIVSDYTTQAEVGKTWNYRVQVQDPNQDQTITYLIPQSTSPGVNISRRGLVTWTPGSDDVDLQQFQISVSDGMRDDLQTVKVFVNDVPRFEGMPDSLAVVGKPYAGSVNVIDINKSQALTFELKQAPAGMSITPEGQITWTPILEQVDWHEVMVSVSDGMTTSERSYRIFVNDPPKIVSTPTTRAATNELYQYRLIVSDGNKTQILGYKIDVGPPGVAVTQNGVLEWTPTNDQVNKQTIKVSVTDGVSVVSQTIDLFVNAPPQILSKPKLVALTNFEYRYQVEALDANGDSVTYHAIQLPADAKLEATTGLIRWVPAREQDGVNDFIIEAVDTHGGVTQHPFQVHVFVDPKTPASQITAFLITLTGIGLVFALTLLL
ncbi:MAG: putative Ig domain-containing protein [Lentisphaeria bacterium]|nr:putative Ig domain-containing protein [Lentisphaeria bacterium]